jgi:hypothetical protein
MTVCVASDDLACPIGWDLVTNPSALAQGDLAEAAAMLRRLLALVEAGELEATTPTARAVLRRLEGAAIAAELAAGIPTSGPHRPDLYVDG